MDRNDSTKKANSGVDTTPVLAPTPSQSIVLVILKAGGLPRVPTVTSAAIYNIPGELRTRQSRFFANKVVLGFEEEFSISRARSWIRSYNQKSAIHLKVFHKLHNALFVVKFDSEDLVAAKNSLLAASPLAPGRSMPQ